MIVSSPRYTNVWLVGGTKVIPTSVEDAIKGDGYTVTRVSGSDRYETAAKIAEAGAKISGKQPSKVFVASGDSFADALAVSPVAYAKGYAIVLTKKDSTPETSKKALGIIGTDAKILVGGTAVVSDSVKADLSIKDRVSGADRAVTANLVANWAKSSEGFQKDDAILVGGKEGFGADSLVASSFGGKNGYSLHFAGWSATETYFKDHSAELTGKGFVIGGKGAVAVADVEKAQAAAQTVVSNQSLKVTPTDAAALPIAVESGTNATADDRVYTVEGLDKDSKYRVTLVNKANITTKDGKVVFTSAAAGAVTVAAPGLLAADISAVNGAPTGADLTSTDTTAGATGDVQSVGGIAPVDGKITFRVDGAIIESLIPVIYVDGGADTRLELDSTGVPTEKFGLGGAVSFVPDEAAFGSVDGEIASHNRDARYLILDTDAAADATANNDANASAPRTLYYDNNDVFKVKGVTVKVEDFMRLAGSGADLDAAYNPNESGVSSFNLLSTVIDPVTDVKAEITDSKDDVKVSWTASPSEGVVYSVTRSDDTTFGDADDVLLKNDLQGVNYTQVDEATGAWYYFVQAKDANTGATASAVRTDSTLTTPLAADITAPTVKAESAVVDVDGGFDNVLDAGDTVQLYFSEDVQIAGNAAIALSDGTDAADVRNGVNSTWTVNGKNVTIKITGDVIDANKDTLEFDGTVGGSDLTITNRSGVSDKAGNTWNLAGGADAVLEDNGPEVMDETAVATNTKFTIVFNEALSKSLAETVGNYTYSDGTAATGDAVTSAVLGSDGRTVTITVNNAVASGATIAPTTSLKDTDGQAAVATTTTLA